MRARGGLQTEYMGKEIDLYCKFMGKLKVRFLCGNFQRKKSAKFVT